MVGGYRSSLLLVVAAVGLLSVHRVRERHEPSRGSRHPTPPRVGRPGSAGRHPRAVASPALGRVSPAVGGWRPRRPRSRSGRRARVRRLQSGVPAPDRRRRGRPDIGLAGRRLLGAGRDRHEHPRRDLPGHAGIESRCERNAVRKPGTGDGRLPATTSGRGTRYRTGRSGPGPARVQRPAREDARRAQVRRSGLHPGSDSDPADVPAGSALRNHGERDEPGTGRRTTTGRPAGRRGRRRRNRAAAERQRLPNPVRHRRAAPGGSVPRRAILASRVADLRRRPRSASHAGEVLHGRR